MKRLLPFLLFVSAMGISNLHYAFPGCVWTFACNYEPFATEDDGSCIFSDVDASFILDQEWYFNRGLMCSGDWEIVILEFTENGFIDSEDVGGFWNYCNDVLLFDIYGSGPLEFWYDGYAFILLADDDCSVGQIEPYQPGCTWDWACNYDPEAVHHVNTCGYAGCDDPSACNYATNIACPEPCEYNQNPVVDFTGDWNLLWNSWGQEGFVETSWNTYVMTVNEDHTYVNEWGYTGTWTLCGSTLAFGDNGNNWYFDALYSDGKFTGVWGWPGEGFGGGLILQRAVAGCTDPAAPNYNENAEIDDGSCLVAGCTYPNALNYNDTATLDDFSCTFPGPTAACPRDLDGDGTVGTADLLDVLGAIGTTCSN